MLECITFRMRGHEEASGTKYVPNALFEEWSKKDPLLNYEDWLLEEGILTSEKIEEIKSSIKAEIEHGLEEALCSGPCGTRYTKEN